MDMPKTHFDCIQALRPYLLTSVKKDVKYLLSIGRKTPILKVAEYENSLQVCLDKVFDDTLQVASENMGVPLDFVKQNVKSLPEFFRNDLFALCNTINDEFHTLVNFLLAGMKTFFFSNEVSQNLTYTEINVPATEIQLPFFCCLLVFKEKEVIDAFYAQAIKDNPSLVIDYSCPISVFVTLFDDCDGLDGRRIVFNAYHSKYPDTIFMGQRRELFLGNNLDLEESLRTDWENLTPDNLGIGSFYNNGDIKNIDDDVFYKEGLLFYRIVLNSILYIIANNTDFPRKNSQAKKIGKKLLSEKSFLKKEKLNQSLNKISKLDYFDVGFSEGKIVLNHKNYDKEQESVDCSRLDRKILRRFMVRGHWRNQRYGSGLKETKLIWIRPYIKGDELAAMINKPYLVKDYSS